jgi:uncharacterized protein YkwD
MAWSKFRRSLRFENLESRQLLSTGSAGPTGQEQYMLQLLNQARTNPSAVAQQIANNITPDVQATLKYYNINLQSDLNAIGSAGTQPPLAWNANLAAAAQGHSQDMANTQTQSHTGSNGSSPQQRMQQAGYNSAASSAENAFAYASSVEEAMEAFLVDWGNSNPGHRVNIQQPGVPSQNAYRDVGIGEVNTGSTTFGPQVFTQDFGSQNNEQAQLVGVAYYDNSGTHFYAPGEGQSGLQIDAVNQATGQVSSTQTWSSGGYALSLSPGRYTIVASLNNQVFQTVNVTIGNTNVQQDFVLSNSWQGGSRSGAISAAQPQQPQRQPQQQQPANSSVSNSSASNSQSNQWIGALSTLTSNPSNNSSSSTMNALDAALSSWGGSAWTAQVS